LSFDGIPFAISQNNKIMKGGEVLENNLEEGRFGKRGDANSTMN